MIIRIYKSENVNITIPTEDNVDTSHTSFN